MTFLGAVDAAEANTFRVGIVEHFNGVAIKHGDDGVCEISAAPRRLHGKIQPMRSLAPCPASESIVHK